jgi:predicted phosphodiesterase
VVRYSILSDVHGRRRKLESVLADARTRGVDQIISLGDVGGDDCLALLHQAGARPVFGNYEVSGWRRLAAEHQAWVRDWPPLLEEDGFLAVHAAPWWPEGLHTVEDFGDWLKRTGLPWRVLFPYLRDTDHVWRAFAELETGGKAILFHGHTHLQTIWYWKPAGRLQQVTAEAVGVKPEGSYVVGVGSVGQPEDGSWAAYALYDADAGHIELMRVDRHSSPVPRDFSLPAKANPSSTHS